MRRVIHYFIQIKLAKAILWCYLIWYLVIVYFYFDTATTIWINAVGISAVIGTGLLLSVAASSKSQRDYWQTFRLYLMPFCVSSFSALIKEEGFIIILSPKIGENFVALGFCVLFLTAIFILKSVGDRCV